MCQQCSEEREILAAFGHINLYKQNSICGELGIPKSEQYHPVKKQRQPQAPISRKILSVKFNPETP